MEEVNEACNLLYPSGRLTQAHAQGGIVLKDEESVITNTVKNVLKSFLSNVWQGNVEDALSLHLPIEAYNPQTYLDSLKYEFACLEEVILQLYRQP